MVNLLKLSGEVILDDLPRLPFTYNPGGRKFLREINQKKTEQKLIIDNENNSSEIKKKLSATFIFDAASDTTKEELSKNLLEILPECKDSFGSVRSQIDVEVQCEMSQGEHYSESSLIQIFVCSRGSDWQTFGLLRRY